MATIHDVARAADVSVATVSRVLNNSPAVTEKTRKMVIDVISELKYQPNLLGRNLRRMETRMVLVLLPSISNPFYSQIVKGIEDVGHENGYNIMLCNTDSNKQREKVYLELLKNKLLDGVIFMAPELDKDALSEIGKSFPVVQCCEYKEGTGVSHVSIDNTSASLKATNHLIAMGHRRIAMLSCENNFVSTACRESGYKKALENAGIEFDASLIKYGDYGFKSGLELTKQLLSIEKKPTAIFAVSDMMAIGGAKAVRENGLKIPEDMAIMGFDDIDFASMVDPMLTTISQPKYDLGCTAMVLLLKQVNGELKEPQNIFLEHELIIRESTLKAM